MTEPEKSKPRPSELLIAARMLFSRAQDRPLLIGAMALTTLSALVPSLPPYLMKHAIDDGVMVHDAARLWLFASLYLGAVLLELVLQLLSQTALATLGQRAMHALRTRIFSHIQGLDLAYFEREPKGKILTRVTNDVEALSEMFTSGAVTMAADVIVLVTIVVAMLLIDVKLTAVAFVTVPPMMLLAEGFRRSARDAFRAVRAHTAELNGFLSEHLAGAAVLLSFTRQPRANGEFAAINQKLQDANKIAIRVDASLFAIVEAIGTTTVAGMIWFFAGDLRQGSLQVGVLIAFIQYMQRFFIPIRDLSSKFAIIQSGLTAAERIDLFLQEKATLVQEAPPAEPASALPVAFEDVSFAYDARRPVLEHVSLTLRPGQKMALVGATGSGKTTMIKLMLRLLDPSAGAISAGGVDLKQWSLGALRDRIAIVPQDPVIFAGTVRENLTLFDAAVADAEIWQAARAIGTEVMIADLPQGLDTPLLERGQNLSSGEAQLLAFTRAIVKSPELLILDEATSSIDAQSEAAVQTGLDALLKGRTAVIIAHRLATLRMANEIVVLSQGHIAERGTHAQLLQKGGIYAALYELQFAKDSPTRAA